MRITPICAAFLWVSFQIAFVEDKQLESRLRDEIEQDQIPDIYGGALALVPIQKVAGAHQPPKAADHVQTSWKATHLFAYCGQIFFLSLQFVLEAQLQAVVVVNTTEVSEGLLLLFGFKALGGGCDAVCTVSSNVGIPAVFI